MGEASSRGRDRRGSVGQIVIRHKRARRIGAAMGDLAWSGSEQLFGTAAKKAAVTYKDWKSCLNGPNLPIVPTTWAACCVRSASPRPGPHTRPAGWRMPKLRAVEDACIIEAIARQEAVGLRAATDGEYRRAYWHYDFVAGLDGVEIYEPARKIEFKGAILPHALRVTGPIRYSHPIMVDHYRFLAAQVKTGVAKQTIPSPSVVHFRGGRDAIDRVAYPDLDHFFADLGSAYRGAVGDFATAGCRYLQLDEVYIAYLCDPEQIAGLKARGEHAEGLLDIYADLINHAIAGRPEDMTISMHLCRGNFRSTWVASGGYEPVAETLFNKIDADAYFMEYDTDRAGGFRAAALRPARAQGRSCWAWSPARPGSWKARTAEAPDRRGQRNICRWSRQPSRSARNAASPRPRRATRSDRGASNGRSCACSSRSPRRCGRSPRSEHAGEGEVA